MRYCILTDVSLINTWVDRWWLNSHRILTSAVLGWWFNSCQFMSIHVNAKGEKSLVKDRYMIYWYTVWLYVTCSYNLVVKPEFREREAASRLYDGALVASLFVWSVLHRADTLHLCEREQWLEHAAGTRCCATPPSNKSWGRLCRGGGQWFLGKTCNHRPVCLPATDYHVQ